MSEPRWMKGLRGGPRERIPEPKKKRLECPVCGGRTVNRDVSPADGYYVEWCYGGVLTLTLPFPTDVSREGALEFITNEFECPYWDAGWENK